MPPKIKFKGEKTKYIFKATVRDFLPHTVVDRNDKMGFPVPLKEWMKGGAVRDFVRETLFSKTCRERGLFRKEALETLLRKEESFGRQLWVVLCLELWRQKFSGDV